MSIAFLDSHCLCVVNLRNESASRRTVLLPLVADRHPASRNLTNLLSKDEEANGHDARHGSETGEHVERPVVSKSFDHVPGAVADAEGENATECADDNEHRARTLRVGVEQVSDRLARPVVRRAADEPAIGQPNGDIGSQRDTVDEQRPEGAGKQQHGPRIAKDDPRLAPLGLTHPETQVGAQRARLVVDVVELRALRVDAKAIAVVWLGSVGVLLVRRLGSVVLGLREEEERSDKAEAAEAATDSVPPLHADRFGDGRCKQDEDRDRDDLDGLLDHEEARTLVEEDDLLRDHRHQRLTLTCGDAQKQACTQMPTVVAGRGTRAGTQADRDDHDRRGNEEDAATTDRHGQGHTDQVTDAHGEVGQGEHVAHLVVRLADGSVGRDVKVEHTTETADVGEANDGEERQVDDAHDLLPHGHVQRVLRVSGRGRDVDNLASRQLNCAGGGDLGDLDLELVRPLVGAGFDIDRRILLDIVSHGCHVCERG
ncbi:hypothetical protein L1887_59887 [Cichorium endivia]|nr:hypothetical protein L1887_59887 [Cichorium endivia]